MEKWTETFEKHFQVTNLCKMILSIYLNVCDRLGFKLKIRSKQIETSSDFLFIFPYILSFVFLTFFAV